MREFLRDSDTRTTPPWKGTASDHSIEIDGKMNRDAARTYPVPKEAARRIRDHIALWWRAAV